MKIKKIRNWETIKNNDGYYNSVMDEINRNYSLSKRIVVEGDLTQIFKKILAALHQTYNINKKIEKGLKFSFNNKEAPNGPTTINYNIEFFDFNKWIIIKWNNKDDQYWTEFTFKQKSKKVIIKYTESVLKKDTISGIQGMIDTSWYKITFKKTFKKWKNMLTINDEKIRKINEKIQELDGQINKIYDDKEFLEANEIVKKYMGKKRLEENQLNEYKNAKIYIEKINKKVNVIQNKIIDNKNNLFIIKDNWIKFVDENYME